jgi:hypothetical protein
VSTLKRASFAGHGPLSAVAPVRPGRYDSQPTPSWLASNPCGSGFAAVSITLMLVKGRMSAVEIGRRRRDALVGIRAVAVRQVRFPEDVVVGIVWITDAVVGMQLHLADVRDVGDGKAEINLHGDIDDRPWSQRRLRTNQGRAHTGHLTRRACAATLTRRHVLVSLRELDVEIRLRGRIGATVAQVNREGGVLTRRQRRHGLDASAKRTSAEAARQTRSRFFLPRTFLTT